MAPGILYYPYPEPPVPTADHLHQRWFQHQGLWRAFTARKANQERVPNFPDADLLDYFSYYLVEVEVPSIKDVNQLQVQWIDANTLLVKGKTAGYEGIALPGDEESKEKAHGHRCPYTIVEERRLGTFERHFTFPSQTVEADNMTAKLEAGLLTLKIPKQHLHLAQNKGHVKVESGD